MHHVNRSELRVHGGQPIHFPANEQSRERVEVPTVNINSMDDLSYVDKG